MNHAELLTAVFTKVSSIADIPNVKYPNVEYSEQEDEYVTVHVMPAKVTDIGVKSVRLFSGIIQIAIYTQHGSGEIVPATYAQRIVDAFERNTTISSGSTTIRIDSTPSVEASMKDESYFVTPVSIIYNQVC